MENTIWEKPQADLQRLLDEEEYAQLEAYVIDNKNLIYSKWSDNQVEDVNLSLRAGHSIMKYFMASLAKKREAIIMELGTLLGIIEGFNYLSYDKEQDLQTDLVMKEDASTIKHLQEVVFALEIHGSMTHTELCNYLGMHSSTLSEAMKRISKTGAIRVRSAGKYRIYTLTDVGIRFGKYLRKEKHSDALVEEVLQTLNTIVLENSSNARIDLADLAETIVAILFPDAKIIYNNKEINVYEKSSYKPWVTGAKIAHLLNDRDSSGHDRLNLFIDSKSEAVDSLKGGMDFHSMNLNKSTAAQAFTRLIGKGASSIA